MLGELTEGEAQIQKSLAQKEGQRDPGKTLLGLRRGGEVYEIMTLNFHLPFLEGAIAQSESWSSLPYKVGTLDSGARKDFSDRQVGGG